MSPMASPYACLYWDSSVVNRMVNYRDASVGTVGARYSYVITSNPVALFRTSRRWSQTCWVSWKFCVFIATGCIYLVLGKIFCACEDGPLEVGLLEVGLLEVGLLEVGLLEVGLL